MTDDELTIQEAALFGYRNCYEALAEHLDLSDDEMLRIFGPLESQMGSDTLQFS